MLWFLHAYILIISLCVWSSTRLSLSSRKILGLLIILLLASITMTAIQSQDIHLYLKEIKLHAMKDYKEKAERESKHEHFKN